MKQWHTYSPDGDAKPRVKLRELLNLDELGSAIFSKDHGSAEDLRFFRRKIYGLAGVMRRNRYLWDLDRKDAEGFFRRRHGEPPSEGLSPHQIYLQSINYAELQSLRSSVLDDSVASDADRRYVANLLVDDRDRRTDDCRGRHPDLWVQPYLTEDYTYALDYTGRHGLDRKKWGPYFASGRDPRHNFGLVHTSPERNITWVCCGLDRDHPGCWYGEKVNTYVPYDAFPGLREENGETLWEAAFENSLADVTALCEKPLEVAPTMWKDKDFYKKLKAELKTLKEAIIVDLPAYIIGLGNTPDFVLELPIALFDNLVQLYRKQSIYNEVQCVPLSVPAGNRQSDWIAFFNDNLFMTSTALSVQNKQYPGLQTVYKLLDKRTPTRADSERIANLISQWNQVLFASVLAMFKTGLVELGGVWPPVTSAFVESPVYSAYHDGKSLNTEFVSESMRKMQQQVSELETQLKMHEDQSENMIEKWYKDAKLDITYLITNEKNDELVAERNSSIDKRLVNVVDFKEAEQIFAGRFPKQYEGEAYQRFVKDVEGAKARQKAIRTPQNDRYPGLRDVKRLLDVKMPTIETSRQIVKHIANWNVSTFAPTLDVFNGPVRRLEDTWVPVLANFEKSDVFSAYKTSKDLAAPVVSDAILGGQTKVDEILRILENHQEEVSKIIKRRYAATKNNINYLVEHENDKQLIAGRNRDIRDKIDRLGPLVEFQERAAISVTVYLASNDASKFTKAVKVAKELEGSNDTTIKKLLDDTLSAETYPLYFDLNVNVQRAEDALNASDVAVSVRDFFVVVPGALDTEDTKQLAEIAKLRLDATNKQFKVSANIRRRMALTLNEDASAKKNVVKTSIVELVPVENTWDEDVVDIGRRAFKKYLLACVEKFINAPIKGADEFFKCIEMQNVILNDDADSFQWLTGTKEARAAAIQLGVADEKSMLEWKAVWPEPSAKDFTIYAVVPKYLGDALPSVIRKMWTAIGDIWVAGETTTDLLQLRKDFDDLVSSSFANDLAFVNQPLTPPQTSMTTFDDFSGITLSNFKWESNSCWIDTVVLSLFKVPGRWLEQEIRVADEARVRTECSKGGAQEIHEWLANDIAFIQSPNDNRKTCYLRRAWFKCMRTQIRENETADPESIYNDLFSFYKLGDNYQKIELDNFTVLENVNAGTQVLFVKRTDPELHPPLNIEATTMQMGACIVYRGGVTGGGHYSVYVRDPVKKVWWYFDNKNFDTGVANKVYETEGDADYPKGVYATIPMRVTDDKNIVNIIDHSPYAWVYFNTDKVRERNLIKWKKTGDVRYWYMAQTKI